MKVWVPANKPLHFYFYFGHGSHIIIICNISKNLRIKFKQQQLCGPLTIGLSRNGQCKTQTADCRLQTADQG